MIRSLTAIALIAVSTAGCSGDQTDEKKEEVSIVPGFSGGCEQPFVVYVQNQFEPLGASLRNDIDEPSEGDVVFANKRLRVSGWLEIGEALYPDNPEGIKGSTWYYVPKLSGWVNDAAVRSEKTIPAVQDSDYTISQAAKKPAECELQRAE